MAFAGVVDGHGLGRRGRNPSSGRLVRVRAMQCCSYQITLIGVD